MAEGAGGSERTPAGRRRRTVLAAVAWIASVVVAGVMVAEVVVAGVRAVADRPGSPAAGTPATRSTARTAEAAAEHSAGTAAVAPGTTAHAAEHSAGPAAVAPGVSAPAGFGVPLTSIHAAALAAAATGKLALLDVVELNPSFDVDARTARTAARLIHEVVTRRA